MKTKRRANVELKAGPPGFPLRDDVPIPGSDRHTLTLKLDEAGAPLWDKFTPPVREAWEKVFTHETTRAAFGVTKVAEPSEVSVPVLNPETAGLVFDLLAQAQAIVLAAAWKLPYAEVLPLLLFSPQEKALVVPPAMRLADKYGKEFLAKWGDEVTLAALVGMISLQKIRTVQGAKEVIAAKAAALKESSIAQTAEAGPAPSPAKDKGNGAGSAGRVGTVV